MPPLGPPPRFFGLKITSNRIESALIMFVTLCLSGIFYGNNLIPAAKTVLTIGVIWSLYLWIIKNPNVHINASHRLIRFAKISKLISEGTQAVNEGRL